MGTGQHLAQLCDLLACESPCLDGAGELAAVARLLPFVTEDLGGPDHLGRNPAWDYDLILDDFETDTPYTWDLCLALLPITKRGEILEEYRRYLAGP